MAMTKRQKKWKATADFLTSVAKKLGVKPDVADIDRRIRRVEMKKGRTSHR